MDERSSLRALRATGGCLWDFVFWDAVLPMGIAFVAVVLFSGGEIDPWWLPLAVVLVFVVALFVVVCVTTIGYLRATQIELECREAAELERVDAREGQSDDWSRE